MKLKAKREKIIKLCRAKSQPVVCAVAACTENSEREKRWFVAAHVANLPWNSRTLETSAQDEIKLRSDPISDIATKTTCEMWTAPRQDEN